jgi:hypothetical protein
MRIEWPTVGLIALAYGGWAASGLWLWPVVPWLALAVMAVLGALHSSLTHECLHGHPTRSRRLNEALVTPPLTLIYPYRRYRANHLAHHHDERLTDPFDDPESYYKARFQWAAMPRWFRTVLWINNTLLGRMVLGPVLGAAGFLAAEARMFRRGARGVRRAWLLHGLGLVPVLGALALFGIPLWLYVVAVVWPALALISIRTFAEHRWHETPEGRTIIVERSPLGLAFSEQQPAYRSPSGADRALVRPAASLRRAARPLAGTERRLCLSQLLAAFPRACVACEGTGGASGPAPLGRATRDPALAFGIEKAAGGVTGLAACRCTTGPRRGRRSMPSGRKSVTDLALHCPRA